MTSPGLSEESHEEFSVSQSQILSISMHMVLLISARIQCEEHLCLMIRAPWGVWLGRICASRNVPCNRIMQERALRIVVPLAAGRKGMPLSTENLPGAGLMWM